MLLRANRIHLLAGVTMVLAVGVGATPAAATGVATPDDVPPVTANPFLPEDRGLGECISAVPKPGCGSEERGGWHQQLVALALGLGLAVIGWRVLRGIRATPRGPLAAGAEPEPPTSPGPPPPSTMERGPGNGLVP